ncbi:Bug family tripartite tricarboxylate transporter substrate binding protein [Achromobacter xylosoxidans]|uniref:Tripartite tricarboxylate transporter substrate binding protein n=1 Tax=Alcaligenes xylosoxydans xylosoxydans TaxID=85698 RepID=A0A0X8P2M0_ALCXX|nr:tripartite tricarboxylate transporter substrate binding protein [Achromobacter xylosoxidans]AMG38758.1 tripartite tricarboxylate transporter substrate binding protein [Achromobacter xylosoxidans]
MGISFASGAMRRLGRRAALVAALGLAALAGGQAQAAFPERPITLVVGFPPGGGGDLYGRLIATAMGKTLGQTVIVENRPGAGGNIAAGLVAKAAPDGYTILLAMSGNLAVSPALKPQSLPYKVPDDFAPIGLILEAPHGLFVATPSHFKTAREVIDAARQKELTFASTGTGGAAHIGMETIKELGHLKLLHVPYKGSGPAITDMLGGQIDMFFATASPLVPQVQQGQLRVLALTGRQRSPILPDVPTFKELGIDMTMTQWYGLAAPAGTPPAVLKVLSEHLSRALADPTVQNTIRKDAAMERDLPMDQFKQYILDDIANYRKAATPDLLKQIGQ